MQLAAFSVLAARSGRRILGLDGLLSRSPLTLPALPTPQHQTPMPSTDPTIILLQLGLRGQPMSFAPHVWKTLLPLRWLQIPFEVELVTLRELREELPTRLGLAKVTLPVSSSRKPPLILTKRRPDLDVLRP